MASVQVRTGGYKSDPEFRDSYDVSGSLTPDATGLFELSGGSGGKPAFERTDEAYFLWFDITVPCWYISESFFDITPAWQKLSTEILGEYAPINGAIGTATVS